MASQPLVLAPEPVRSSGTLQQAFGAFSPTVLREQVQLIQEAMQSVMVSGLHYGVIPGTERKDKDGNDISKPTLLKPGAEKLCFMFRLSPKFRKKITDLGGGHREVQFVCELHTRSGEQVGEGVGSCSTMESKYRYRSGKRKCPTCGKESIIQTKSGRNPGGYWCIPDKGGCNSNFNAGDPAVEKQQLGRTENLDIADVYNTVLKMAKKRAYIDATLTAMAASDIFEQDLDDIPQAETQTAPERPKEKPPQAPNSKPPAPAPAPVPAPVWPETLYAKDKALATEGLCNAGDLVAHITKLGGANGADADLTKWGRDWIAWARPLVVAFEQERRKLREVAQTPVAVPPPESQPHTHGQLDATDMLIRQIHSDLERQDKLWMAALMLVGVPVPDHFEEPEDAVEAQKIIKPLATVEALQLLAKNVEPQGKKAPPVGVKP